MASWFFPEPLRLALAGLALLAYGPNLEWRVQAARGLARFSNGFEQGEGRLQALAEGGWQVDFGLDEHEQLRRSGAELLQGEGPSWPAQRSTVLTVVPGISCSSSRVFWPMFCTRRWQGMW